MATNRTPEELDQYEIYALKVQLDNLLERFFVPETGKFRPLAAQILALDPGAIEFVEEWVEATHEKLGKALTEVIVLWLEVGYWRLEEAVSRVLFVRPETEPETFAQVCRWLKASE